jgi:hypothetical protein
MRPVKIDTTFEKAVTLGLKGESSGEDSMLLHGFLE